MRAVLVMGLVATGSLALAHSGATGIVKERMDGMGTLAASMKSLVGLHKGGAVDAESVGRIARAMKAHSGRALTRRFPEGSMPPVSEASPEIWRDWARFVALSDALFAAADRLETEATSPGLDLGAHIEDLGATCSGCHKVFRIEK